MNRQSNSRGIHSRRNALAMALAIGLGFTGVALGQATTGAIFGNAPSAAGQTVRVTGAGVNRTVNVGTDGRYSVAGLPVGTYTVTLNDSSGKSVSTRNNVSISVGGGTEVDFAASTAKAQRLGTVLVNAGVLPAIDVTSVNSSTIITSDDLQKLPVGRSAEAIALLAPGTVQGSSMFGAMMGNGNPLAVNTISMGASSVAENAYYVNGYNTGEPYRNIGGFQLPYGAIAQQETLSGGFSAKYGRSDGGVISQIGKRGTNKWHFGGQVAWQPRFLESNPVNGYLPVQPLPNGTFDCVDPTASTCVNGKEPYTHEPTYQPGKLWNYREKNKGWETIYSAYVGGPLVKDKLYMFAAAEYTQGQNTSISSRSGSQVSYSSSHQNRFYGKLDWNINDNNLLEATYLESDAANGSGATYNFDYNTLKSGTFKAVNNNSHNNAKFMIAKYTGYISDNATLSVLWGKGDFANPTTYGNKSNLPFISGGANQDPAFWGPNVDPNVGIINNQTNISQTSPDAAQRTRGLRIDFNYQLGNHNLGFGIDNMNYTAHDQSFHYTGGPAPAVVSRQYGDSVLDGTRWVYRVTTSGFHYVYYLNVKFQTSMSMAQKAYYLQDTWQPTDNLQLNLGLRNDHYTNYNDQGVAFVDEKNQWEPRLGFSWDVNGDSSLKIFGNAGRYYLALPNNAAERAANRSTFVYQFFTYTGIDANGEPTGLSPFTGLLTPDGELARPKDPKQVTASNLRPMYVDQYNLGFDKKLGEKWVYGAKVSYRSLKTTIDDECSPYEIAKKMGITQTGSYSSANYYAVMATPYADSILGAAYCRLINPGQTNNMLVQNSVTGGYKTVQMSQSDWGYLQKPKRNYAALDLYLEHPFDGTWYGRIDYTYTDAKGNTSGQVRPDFGQADVSKTEDWDSWQLMQGQDGELLNSRKHIFRIRGAYQVTPGWLISTTALIQSGTPQECLGYFGPQATGDPTGYNRGGTGNYHWCAGQIVHPGSSSRYAGHTPWTETINLGVRYTPAFADRKLALKLDIFNALNQQKATQTQPSLVAGPHLVSNFFHYPLSYQPPRYMRLSVSYDY